MIRQLLDEGVIIAQLAGATNSTHMLYVKGAVPTPPTPPEPVDLTVTQQERELAEARRKLAEYEKAAADTEAKFGNDGGWGKSVDNARAEVTRLEAQIGVTVQ
jgi:hypothetical protein